MKSFISISLVIIFTIAVLTFESAYNVDDISYAVITQFGKPIKVVKNAGWHFKIPFLQQVHYEPNTLELKEDSFQPLTKDKNTNDFQKKTQKGSHEANPEKLLK